MAVRILIVEDDVLNRMFYKAVFEDRGYETELVDDGAQVLERVASFQPDLITMDIQLPHVSGGRLIRALRKDKATKHIPVIAITAFVGKEEEVAIRRAGADAYLKKPVTIDQLLEHVDAIMGKQ